MSHLPGYGIEDKTIVRAGYRGKRLPQDGKFSIKIASAFLDIRVSTIPTVKGEGVVLRLLYRERLTYDIMRLGLEADYAKVISELILRPYGMLLVTGPTGSGKTTTLYSILTRLNSGEKNSYGRGPR